MQSHEDYDMMRFYSVELDERHVALDATGAVAADWAAAKAQMARLGSGAYGHNHGGTHKVSHLHSHHTSTGAHAQHAAHGAGEHSP